MRSDCISLLLIPLLFLDVLLRQFFTPFPGPSLVFSLGGDDRFVFQTVNIKEEPNLKSAKKEKHLQCTLQNCTARKEKKIREKENPRERKSTRKKIPEKENPRKRKSAKKVPPLVAEKWHFSRGQKREEGGQLLLLAECLKTCSGKEERTLFGTS